MLPSTKVHIPDASHNVRSTSVAGSLRERPQGSNCWELRASAGRDHVTGRYHQASRTFHGTRKQAEKALARLVTEVDAGKVSYDSCTVAQLYDRWIAHLERLERAPNTLRGYRWLSERVLAEFGTQQIRRVTGVGLDAFYGRVHDEVRKTGRDGKQTAEHTHRMLRAMFRQAVRWGLLDKSPTDRATAVTLTQIEPESPEPGQIAHLVTAAAEHGDADFGSLIYVAAATGLRRGELCGLRWSDIDFDREFLIVRRSVSVVQREVHVREPKTHKGRRLTIGAQTMVVLDAQRRRAWHRCQAIGTDLAPDAYVWSSEADYSEPLKPDAVTGAFRRLCVHEGVKGLRFHYLRHFGISQALAAGVDVRTVAGRAGHSSPTLTLSTYAHVIETADRHAASVVEQSLALERGPE